MSTSVVSQIESRLLNMTSDISNDYDDVFDILCSEFGLDADSHAAKLGCKCPFGLIGYLQVALAEE
jgi:hypothetical protein